jgi:hypothetical protein
MCAPSGASVVSIPSRSQAPDEGRRRSVLVRGREKPVRFLTLDGALLALRVFTASTMSTRSRAPVILVLALLSSSCGYVKLPRLGWRTAFAGRPVALLMEGSAFSTPVRARTARELQRELGRPVNVVEALPSAADDDTRALAARVVGERSLRYDWREPRCAWDRALLAGITRDVDAVFRAVLEYSERTRPATDEEWESFKSFQGIRVGFRRLDERPTVREEVVTGIVTRTALVLKDPVARASLHRRRVTLATDDERVDVAAAVADAVHELGAVPDPEWEGLALRQMKQGCPFLALAIADTQLPADQRESVQTAAIAAMRGSPERAASRPRAETGAPRKPASAREPDKAPVADLRAASETPEAEETPEAPRAAPQVSCHSLCEMHMVEICNTDKVLWSAHRARWEPTPCGTRRDEPFLAQCYQEQWDTGTFETSCVQPCEASDAGRSRLMAILQDAGCVSGPGPS